MRRPGRLRIVVRWRAARSRLARFVTGSLAAHGALVAILVVIPSIHRAPVKFNDTMVVALAGPLPGPPAPARAAAQAPAAPAAPKPTPPPKEAHAVREVPKPAAKPVKPSLPKPKDDPKPAPPGDAPPQDAAPNDAPAGADKPGGEAQGPTGVTGVLGGGDSSLGFYQGAVRSALESAWQKPVLEEQGETYSVTVTFTIARDGTVRDVVVSQPSGVPSLDRSAIRAVMGASPLPPIPAAWTGGELPATMRFDLTPETL